MQIISDISSKQTASKPAGSAKRFNLSIAADDLENLKLKQLDDAQSVADSTDLGELALRDTDPGMINPTVYYFHPDHLGSSTMISDKSGYAYQFFLNLPFGANEKKSHAVFFEVCERSSMAEQRRSGSLNNPFKFNGKELDSETGLYYYGARYYDPRISLFISVDPLAEMTMTPYQYTYQNPVNLIDPTGMAAEAWPPKDGKEGQTWKDTDGNFKFMNGRWYRDGGIFREMLTGERYASVGGGGGNPSYEGEELLSSSIYDYSYEIMPGKQNDDVKYIKNGKSGNQISRYLQILKRDFLADGNEAASFEASTVILLQSRTGKYTQPKLPQKTILNKNGVTIEHYYKSGDHLPPHMHVEGGGPSTKIGTNGKPIKGSPKLSPTQQSIIQKKQTDN